MNRSRFEQEIAPEVGFVARICHAMSDSPADAEDLAQETLLRAFRGMSGFDGRYARAWLFQIARNAAISRYRHGRDFLVPDDEVEGQPAPSAEERALDRSLADGLARALGALPPGYRVVVVLVDVEGLRYQEAAELLHVPVGTVMSRLHRARARLRHALRGTELDPTRRAP